MKGQEYTLEENYKNLLDVVNDLRKRVKSLEIQNQPGKMSTLHENIETTNKMNPLEKQNSQKAMSQENIQAANINEMNRPSKIKQSPLNPQPSETSKSMKIEFLFKDFLMPVYAESNMTIKKLITNFRIKLCNPSIKIEKYLIHPTRIEIDPTSTETLSSKGINESIKIIAVTK